MIKMLLECKKLPNTLSRQCFLGYAMGKIISQPESSIDYWFSTDINNMDSPIRYTDSIDTGFQITTWLKQYYRFMNYMAEFIIPIYQWCFIGMLFETIENIDSEQQYSKGLTKEEIYRENLIKAFELLTRYMDKYANEMLCPVSIELKNTPFMTENLSVLMKHRYEKEYNMSSDAVAEIAKSLLFPNADEEIELNLKLINPLFFKDCEGIPIREDRNFVRIQKFYTDLIRRKYLNKFGK
jgi:hypothetical protein